MEQTQANQLTELQKNEETITLPIKTIGNGKLRTIELSKKQWSITRENNDRWLFTEVKI